jgi:hypothetical protein
VRVVLGEESVVVRTKQRRARGPSEVERVQDPGSASSLSVSAPFENGDDLSGSHSPSFLAHAGRMHMPR